MSHPTPKRNKSLETLKYEKLYKDLYGYLPEDEPKEEANKMDDIESGPKLLAKLDKMVKGHQQAKKVLINIITRVQLRAHGKDVLPMNALLIGESGTGKTYLVECLKKIVDFPYLAIDATGLTHTSATGLTAEGLKKKIFEKAEEERKELAALGQTVRIDAILNSMVIFVDEIDKLGMTTDANNWNKGTQTNFLRLFENKEKGLENVTWVFAGAFSGMDIYNDQYKTEVSKRIGFTTNLADVKTEKESEDTDLVQKVIKFGLIPELVGRMHHLLPLDKLDKKQFREILDEIIIPNKEAELRYFGITFDLTEEQKDEVVEVALKRKLGVRGMKTAIEEHAVDMEFNFNHSQEEVKEENKE